jgi:hypothetical protein
MELSPEQIGIRGTPGMKAVAELRKRRRLAETPKKLPPAWEGAQVSDGTVEVIRPNGDREFRTAKIYRKGSAVATVFKGKKVPGLT